MIRLLLLALAYFVTGWLGLRLPYAGSSITLVWLPAGIAVAGMVTWGRAAIPAVYAASFMLNMVVAPSWPLAAGIAAGNTLGPWLAAWCLQRLNFSACFHERRHVATLLVAAGGGMLVSSTGGVLCLYLADRLGGVPPATAWLSWWMGDTVGVLLTTPLLLTLNRRSLAKLGTQAREAISWLLVSAAVGGVAFLYRHGPTEESLPLAFLTLPLVAWAATRLNAAGATLAGFGFSMLAAVGTGIGRGTFHLQDPHVGLFLMWSYMAITMLMSLMVTALQAERVQAEETLRRSEERLKEAQHVARLGNYEVDVATKAVWASDELARLWGRQPGDIQPTLEAYLEAIHPKDLPRTRETLDRAMHQGGTYEKAFRVRWPDGSLREIRSLGRVVNDALGKPQKLVGVAQDVTEEKLASAELQRSETRFRSLYDSLSDAVLSVGKDHIVECNQAALDLFGCPSKEVMCRQHPGRDLSPPTQPGGEPSMELARQRIEEAFREGKARFEWVHKRLDNGKTFPAEIWLTAMELDGEPVLQGIVRDITERKRAEERIRSLAFYDELTQLPNRRLMMDRLGQALVTSHRKREYGAVMMLDLDNFKYLNDTQGHDAGDRLLIEASRRIQANVRQKDTVSRLGGDEYVVLVEGLGTEDAAAATHAELIAEKVLKTFQVPFEVSANGRPFRTSCSIGVALFHGQDLSIEELLKQADVALYQAKDAGKNAVRFFNPAMQSVIESYSAMEAALHQALQESEFRLFYQPQFDGRGLLLGAEALMRWFPDGMHPVAPPQFIPLAEQTGLIIPMGAWVLQTACEQLRAWATHPDTRELVMSVNVSARQFREPDFIRLLQETVQRTGVDPRLLKLELTEAVVLHNVDDAIARMLQIKEMGITFSLDDFGTGFSSLSYLKRLPLDQVKIDGSFVQDVTEDAGDAAIVRAIVAMSRSLGLQVVAEGVESHDQLAFLLGCGCEVYQGNLLGKPMPIGEWAQWQPFDWRGMAA